MKGLGLFVIAALFSTGVFAQVNTEDRDLQNRKEPVKTEKKTTTKTKTEISKEDVDHQDMKMKKSDHKDLENKDLDKKDLDSRDLDNQDIYNKDLDSRDLNDKDLDKKDMGTRTKTETTTKTESVGTGEALEPEDNTICCGLEKDNGLMGIWKFDVQNSQKEDKVVKHYAKKPELKDDDNDKDSDLNKSDLKKSDADVSTESDIYNHDTRMDAGGRTSTELEGSELDSGKGVKSDDALKSGTSCPGSDVKDSESLEDTKRMENDNSPKF